MDIFVIKTSSAENVSEELLKQFQKKPFSDKEALTLHCLSYLMLDRILREVYKIEDREIVFKNKKPSLKSGDIHFSISHSKDYIALGFTDNNCGIDIENINQKRDWEAIAKRMRLDSTNKEEFYKDWTKFEANHKLGGQTREEYSSIYTTQIDEYVLTAVSENPEEKFELYLQN